MSSVSTKNAATALAFAKFLATDPKKYVKYITMLSKDANAFVDTYKDVKTFENILIQEEFETLMATLTNEGSKNIEISTKNIEISTKNIETIITSKNKVKKITKPTPVVNEPTPVVVKPTIDESTPVVVKPTIDTSTPVVNASTPVVDASKPVINEPTPVVIKPAEADIKAMEEIANGLDEKNFPLLTPKNDSIDNDAKNDGFIVVGKVKKSSFAATLKKDAKEFTPIQVLEQKIEADNKIKVAAVKTETQKLFDALLAISNLEQNTDNIKTVIELFNYDVSAIFKFIYASQQNFALFNDVIVKNQSPDCPRTRDPETNRVVLIRSFVVRLDCSKKGKSKLSIFGSFTKTLNKNKEQIKDKDITCLTDYRFIMPHLSPGTRAYNSSPKFYDEDGKLITTPEYFNKFLEGETIFGAWKEAFETYQYTAVNALDAVVDNLSNSTTKDSEPYHFNIEKVENNKFKIEASEIVSLLIHALDTKKTFGDIPNFISILKKIKLMNADGTSFIYPDGRNIETIINDIRKNCVIAYVGHPLFGKSAFLEQ